MERLEPISDVHEEVRSKNDGGGITKLRCVRWDFADDPGNPLSRIHDVDNWNDVSV